MSNDDVLNISVAVPPSFEEQQAIAVFLASKLKQYDQTTSEAEQAIGLMQERRTALISAAVTGKIDVRDWSPADNGQLPTANPEQEKTEATL